MHFGGIIGPPNPLEFADGKPYGVGHVTGPNNQNELSDATLAALEHMATRVITTATKLAS